MRNVLSVAAALLLLAGANRLGAQEICDVNEQLVVGVVRGEENGAPLPGVRVQTEVAGREHAVYSDSAGRYALKLPTGTYRMRASSPRWYREEREIGIPLTCGGARICGPLLYPKPCDRVRLDFGMRVHPLELEA